MRNPNEYGQFACYDDDCNWAGDYSELDYDDLNDFGCPDCKGDVFEACPFCGDEFDTDIRVCGYCREQV